MYHVFLGAPTVADLNQDARNYQWRTIIAASDNPSAVTGSNAAATGSADSSEFSVPNPSFGFTIPSAISTKSVRRKATETKAATSASQRPLRSRRSTILAGNFTQAPLGSVMVFPRTTIEAASQRISLFYKNAIVDQEDVDPEEIVEEAEEGHARGDQTTLYTWPATTSNQSRAADDTTAPSLFQTTRGVESANAFNTRHNITSVIGLSTGLYETQEETQNQSYNTTSTSSIAHFPTFHFSLHSLTSLGSLTQITRGKKLSFVLAALEVDGPSSIRIKRGPDAGKEVTLLSMILGDEEGMICKLTAWREVAEDWAGVEADVGEGVKRGDVVYIENVTATVDPASTPMLTASPSLNSRMQICYRTMPYTREDNKLRPDLRLGQSDAAVKKVAGVTAWFERMAGLA